jgi:hypothetical protein
MPVNPPTESVVPKKPRALKGLYFYVQTVEVGFGICSTRLKDRFPAQDLMSPLHDSEPITKQEAEAVGVR